MKMLNELKNIRLLYKFIALFMVMALIVAATGGFGIRKLRIVGDRMEEVLRTRSAQQKMTVLLDATSHKSQVYLLQAAMVLNDVAELEKCKVEYELKRDWFRGQCDLLLKGSAKAGIEAPPPGSDLERNVKAVQESWTGFESVAEKLLARKATLLEGVKSGMIHETYKDALTDRKLGDLAQKELSATSGKVNGALDDLLVTVGNLMTETKVEVSAIQRKAKIALGAVSILSMILAVLLGQLANRRIITPISRLDHAANLLAMGDLSARVKAENAGELRMLFNSFNHMAEKLGKRTGDLLDAQEELVRKEKLAILGQLSGSVGHELRNPLGVMSNAVYFLQMVLADADETTKEYLGIIKKEIDNSQRIITDLLDFARTKTPQVKAVTACELLNECLGRCTVPENVELRAELTDTLPPLRVDPLQMGQVLQNLITNGVQAMPDGGTLRIAARRVLSSELRVLSSNLKAETSDPKPDTDLPLTSEFKVSDSNSELRTQNSELDGDFIEISVADTGEGIAPENLKKLFQPLFTTKAKGIGLGLVVCRNLTEANGGRIGVESRPGEGTTFTLILPVEGG